MSEYNIDIKHIFICEQHSFKKPKEDGKDLPPLIDTDSVEAVAGSGLRGDRYFDQKEDGQVTFFSMEVYRALVEDKGEKAGPSFHYRNVVTEGVALNTLIGERFEIDGMEFEGTEECSPCPFMDKTFGPGTREFLTGRGGLRARILNGGTLKKGPTALKTNVDFTEKEILMRESEL